MINKTRIAIVPARKGSKRIKDKNIKNFAGKPMIQHILSSAVNANLFEVIHVSTDCPNIASIANEVGGSTDFLRPSSLAADDTPLLDVLQFVVKAYEKLGMPFDEVWLLMACTPLLTADDLIDIASYFDKMLKKQDTGVLKMLSTGKFPAPVEWAYQLTDSQFLVARNPSKIKMSSQFLEESYFDAGAFCIYSKNALKSENTSGYSSKYIPYFLPRHKCIDIDNEDDWNEALEIYELLNNSKD